MGTKIDFGIDLGTTNSAIARMVNGESKIIKTDQQADTMPSAISFNKKQTIQAGAVAFKALKNDKLRAMQYFKEGKSNTFIEFKRSMGSEIKYNSGNMGREYTSEELSAEVLKKLKSFVPEEDLNSIVITVPAMFQINQKDATVAAARMAGFQHCELLQEPIAASMAYGLDAGSADGFWLVFDFGGGTFDAALLKVEDGIMKVIDTEGDNHLGGKNLDFAIVDEVIIPYLQDSYVIDSILGDDTKKEILRQAMKYYAEETKIQLSFQETHNILSDLGDIPGEDDEGEEFELDITVSQEDLATVVGPFFQKAIDLSLELLKRKNLSGNHLGALIPVGGPTFSPILRNMLKEQITDKVDTSVDPMTCVARGAALFASTIDITEGLVEQKRDKTKIQLSLGYEPSTVEPVELITIKLLKDKIEGEVPEAVFAEIERSDKNWSSGKVEINETGDVVEVALIESQTNAFNVVVYDPQGNRLPCEPDGFTIIQGSKMSSATLPYHIGIEIKSRAVDRRVFKALEGLEKNQSMPAKGIANNLKTQKDIRPGEKDDFISIPIYEGDYYAEGSRGIYNHHINDVLISGEDLPKLLPQGSDVDVTINVNRSGTLSLSAFFPYLEFEHEVENIEVKREGIDRATLETEIQKAEQALALIKQEGVCNDSETLEKLTRDLNDLHKRFDQGGGDRSTREEVLNNLKKCSRKLDEIEDATEWPKIESELKDSFYSLEKAYAEFKGRLEGLNEDRIQEAIQQYKDQIPEVIKGKNVKVAREMASEIRSLRFTIIDIGLGADFEIGLLHNFHKDFGIHDWKDEQEARRLIDQGLQMAQNNPSKERLRPILQRLYKLLPDWDEKASFKDDTVLTD